jgi:hypothetical protein
MIDNVEANFERFDREMQNGLITHKDELNKYKNLEINDYESIAINDLDVNIFRFKFTDAVMEDLSQFAKIHQYDDRHSFKEAWTKWLEENNEIITNEVVRLEDLGYEGDIIDKMFKSARYYYRKKSTEKKAPKERRQYVSVQRELLDAMDAHIKKSILSNESFKPQQGFIDFCNAHREVLQDAVAKLCESGITNSQEIQSKIKKTYKNRYFMIARKDNARST